jgi:hypothetical protein
MIKPVPARLQKRITEIGGLTPDGMRPLFRVMRGCDRFTVIGGRWQKYDANGNRTGEWIGTQRVLKYPEAESRYIFELWCPPENYGTEEQWNQNFRECIDGHFVDTLGPYPGEGEYELLSHMGILERVYKDQKTGAVLRKEFVPLTETLCDAIVLTAKMNKELPVRIKMEAAKARREQEEKAKDDRQIAMIEDMSRPDWAKAPHIIHPGFKETRSPGGIILP